MPSSIPSPIAVDERDFFGRIDLLQRADTHRTEKAQIFVRLAVHVGVEKGRVLRIVNGGEDVGIHVVDGLALARNAWVRP